MFNFSWFSSKQKPKSIQEIAEANREAYKAYLGGLKWETYGDKPEMLWAYTDMHGNNYYVPRNIWQGISRNRLISIETASLALEYRQDRAHLIESMRRILAQFQKCQNGDLEAAHEGYSEAWKVFELARTAPSEEVLMEYAVNLVYCDGENPQLIDPEIFKLKRQRAESDIGLKAFFLNMGLSVIQTSLPISQPVGLGSLETPEMESRKLSKQEISRQNVSKFISKSDPKKNLSQTGTQGS